MNLRRSLVILLVGMMLVLTPMAYASPPDPSWFSGLWDNGDFDDVVLMITGSAGAVEVHCLDEVGPALSLVTSIVPADEVPAPTLLGSAAQTRAPPASA